MPQQPQPLGPDDYRQLYQMSTSSDESVRAQASTLSKKLTSAEQKEFFNYQMSQHPRGEIGRVDNSLLGLPPEAAVVGGLGVGRAVAAPAASVGSRVAAGVSAVAGQAAPVIKYEIVKGGLKAIGVPEPFPTIAGLIVSGARRGGAAKAAEEAPTVLPEGVDPHMPNVSAGPTTAYGQSAAGVPTTVAEPHMPNVSADTPPSYGPPANVPNRPWGSGVPAPAAPVVDPHMPNVSAGPQPAAPAAGWATNLAENPDAWKIDRYMPNVSASHLTEEQLAAQAAVHHAPVLPADMPAPSAGPQGVPASMQMPKSWSALLRPPSDADVAIARHLVTAGKSAAEAAQAVANGDPLKASVIASLLEKK